MAQKQRSNALKFGNWESEEDVPYTAYFDKARKVKTPGGNPKDTEENPGLYADYGAPSQSVPPKPKSDSEAPAGRRPSRQGREGMKSREDSDFKQFMQSPARHGGNHGRSQNEAGDKQASRSYGNSKNNSYETSPLHHQAKVSGRVVGARSPFWDGNKGSYDGGSARRSRPRTNLRGDESPDEIAAVPKFGDWNENDPSSADAYTHIFNRVREERNNAGTPRTPSHPNTRNQQPPTDSVKCCCFSWGGK